MNRAVAMQQPQNAVQLLTTSTGGVGELANFLMGASYVVVAGVIYKHRKTKKTALIACIAASVVMGIAAALANDFLLLPLVENHMPPDQLIVSTADGARKPVPSRSLKRGFDHEPE